LSNGFVYALLLAQRHIWTENDPPPSNTTTRQASEVLFAAGDFRVAGYDTSTFKRYERFCDLTLENRILLFTQTLTRADF
jgi:hypothetical protein